MAYGEYYRPQRAARMGDMLDPRVMAGASMAGINPMGGDGRPVDPPPHFVPPPPPPPGAPPGAAPQNATPPGVVTDRWGRRPGHPQYGQPPEGDTTPDYNFGGDEQGPFMGTTAAKQPGIAKRSYQGGPLAYYGVGNIEGVEDIFRRRGTAGTLTGFNEKEWLSGNRGTMSIKNVNGAIFTRYAAKPSSIDLVLADPDFQALFPNAKKVGFDKIDYGDGKPVDVLKSANPETDSAEAWTWQPESEAVPEGAGTAAASDITSGRVTTLPVGVRAPLSTDRYQPAIDRDGGYRGPSFRDWVDPAERRYR